MNGLSSLDSNDGDLLSNFDDLSGADSLSGAGDLLSNSELSGVSGSKDNALSKSAANGAISGMNAGSAAGYLALATITAWAMV